MNTKNLNEMGDKVSNEMSGTISKALETLIKSESKKEGKKDGVDLLSITKKLSEKKFGRKKE